MNYYLFFPIASVLINVFTWSYVYAQKLGAGKYVRKPYNLEKIGLAVREELERALPKSISASSAKP